MVCVNSVQQHLGLSWTRDPHLWCGPQTSAAAWCYHINVGQNVLHVFKHFVESLSKIISVSQKAKYLCLSFPPKLRSVGLNWCLNNNFLVWTSAWIDLFLVSLVLKIVCDQSQGSSLAGTVVILSISALEVPAVVPHPAGYIWTQTKHGDLAQITRSESKASVKCIRTR